MDFGKQIIHSTFAHQYKRQVMIIDRRKYTTIEKDSSVALYHVESKTLIYYESDELNSEYRIKDGTKEIGPSAFYMAANLTKVILPASIEHISSSAFYECRNLKTVVLNEGLVNIDNYAFKYCDSLEKVEIPASVSQLGFGVFNGCNKLKKVLIHSENKYFQAANKFIYSKDESLIITYLHSQKRNKITVPEGTIEIGQSAFCDCDSLEEIILPKSIRIIHKRAFENCYNLKQINLPEGLEIIEDSAFHGTALQSIHIPATAHKIGNEVFAYCSSLERITVSSNNRLYQSLKGILISKTNRLIGYPSGTNNSAYQIPDCINSIANGAFTGTQKLQKITFNNRIKNIPDFCFSGCSDLKEVVLTPKLKKIGKCAFEYCVEIVSVTLPDQLEVIDDSAFFFCNKLNSLNIPSKLKKLGENALFETNNINFTINSQHPIFKIIDGDIYEKRIDAYEKNLSSNYKPDNESNPF